MNLLKETIILGYFMMKKKLKVQIEQFYQK